MNSKINSLPAMLASLCLMFSISSVTHANVVPDSSFEGGTKNWTLEDGTVSFTSSHVRSGSKALKMVNTGNGTNSSDHEAYQNRISGVVAGQEYIYSVWVSGNNLKGVGGGGKPLGVVRWRDSSGNMLRNNQGHVMESYVWAPYGTYGFQNISTAMQAPARASSVDIIFRTWWGTTSGESYWDDVTLSPRQFSGLGSLLSTYQAENAKTLSGGAIRSILPDYTGSGYYDMGTSGAIVEWDNVVGGGSRVLLVRYSWEGYEQPIELFVNGVSQGIHQPMATGHRGTWASELWNVNLPSGNNKVRLKFTVKGDEKSHPLVDKLDVYNVGSGGTPTPPPTDSTPTNNPPVLTSITSKTVVEGELLVVPVSASDSDSASIALSQTNTLPGKPNILTDYGNGVGEIKWTPAIGSAVGSPYSVTVTAKDNNGASTSKTFSVTVTSRTATVGGAISSTLYSAPKAVNLSAEGVADWVHWGLSSAGDTNRKAGTPLISSLYLVDGAIGPRGTNSLTSFSWSNGSPTGSVNSTYTGRRVYNVNKGFSFTVPAKTTSQTLRVYVGASGAAGLFKATLNDGSTPASIIKVEQLSGTTSRVITVNFKAAIAGQLLTVSYVVNSKATTSGWISLHAATLQNSSTASVAAVDQDLIPKSQAIVAGEMFPVTISRMVFTDSGFGLAKQAVHNAEQNQSWLFNPAGDTTLPLATDAIAFNSWKESNQTS